MYVYINSFLVRLRQTNLLNIIKIKLTYIQKNTGLSVPILQTVYHNWCPDYMNWNIIKKITTHPIDDDFLQK